MKIFETKTTFLHHANPITKIFSAIILFIIVILIHDFNFIFYLAVFSFFYMIFLSGAKLKLLLIISFIFIFFGFLSSTYMIFYGLGENSIFKLGFINITSQSLVRGLHLMLRTLVLSFYGVSIFFSTKVVLIFYSLMQQLKLRPSFAYSFMASFRMLKLIFHELILINKAFKIRENIIKTKNYKGFKKYKQIIIMLLARSIQKAHYLSISMQTKGFSDEKRTYFYKTSFSVYDIYYLFCLVLLITLSYFFADTFSFISSKDVRFN